MLEAAMVNRHDFSIGGNHVRIDRTLSDVTCVCVASSHSEQTVECSSTPENMEEREREAGAHTKWSGVSRVCVCGGVRVRVDESAAEKHIST